MASPQTLLPANDASAASRLLTMVGVVVVLAGLYFGRPVLVPLALALGFAFLLTPVVSFLQKARIGRVPAVLIAMIVTFALLALMAWGVSRQLMDIVVHLPDYRANIHEKVVALRAPASGNLGKATATMKDLSKELSSATDNAGAAKLSKAQPKEPIAVQVAAPPRTAAEYLRDVAGPLTGILETAGIVVIFTLFILVKREDLRNRLFRLAGSGQMNVMTQALDEASQRLGRYLLLQFLVNVGYGALFGLGVYAIGIPHPFLWGVVGFLFRFVPYIGTPLAALFPMAMAMAVFPGWLLVGETFALFVVLEITIANVVEPLLYGSHTGVSSLAILVAAIFWGMLWGPVGLILSTPLTVCLILLGRYVPQLKFLEIILGDEPVLSPQAHFYQRLLALDDGEAKDIADAYLAENPLAELYDSVLIPALSLAEQDRQRNALDQTQTQFIYQSTRDLMDELCEKAAKDAEGAICEEPKGPTATAETAGLKVICVPARGEADAIVGTMAAQLLRQAGMDAHALTSGSIEEILEQVEHSTAGIICVSALPPVAMSAVKILCKQIRLRAPLATVIVGLWGYRGQPEQALERLGARFVDRVGLSLAQVVSLAAGDKVEDSAQDDAVDASAEQPAVAK